MENSNVFKILAGQIPCRVDRSKLESPLEEFFIEKLEKYISPNAQIYPQFEVTTSAGNFRLDFVVEINGKKIGFECDGEKFHNVYRDEWRDAMILGQGEIETIYRFRGKDLHTFLDDCIYIIFHYDNKVFNERYKFLAPQLISNEIKSTIFEQPYYKERNHIHYIIFDEDGDQVGHMELMVERRSIHIKGHWQILFQFALKHPNQSLDKIIEKRAEAK